MFSQVDLQTVHVFQSLLQKLLRHLGLEITELRVGRVQDAFLELLNQNVCPGEWVEQRLIQPRTYWC